MQSVKEKIKERERVKNNKIKSYYADIMNKKRSEKMKKEYSILKIQNIREEK